MWMIQKIDNERCTEQTDRYNAGKSERDNKDTKTCNEQNDSDAYSETRMGWQ